MEFKIEPLSGYARKFLMEMGFTHFYREGIIIGAGDYYNNDYVLIPIKPGHRYLAGKNNCRVNKIDAVIIDDMIRGVEFINFVVKLSAGHYNNYLKNKGII